MYIIIKYDCKNIGSQLSIFLLKKLFIYAGLITVT